MNASALEADLLKLCSTEKTEAENSAALCNYLQTLEGVEEVFLQN